LARQQELAAGAFAEARTQGTSRPAAIAQRMADLMTGTDSTSLRLQAQADRFATRAVFQETPGPILQRIMALKNDPAIPAPFRTVMTFTLPFIKTPGNILRQGAEFSPAGFLMKAAQEEGRPGAQALGRAALGSLALAPLAYLAATGRLSGNGPTDRGERTALMEQGWRPNSVKIGNDWVAYNLFQPISVAVAAVANAWERFAQSDRSDKAAEESFTAALSGAASSFLDQSFLAGINGLLDAVQDPERNSRRFLSQFVQGLVPASGLMRNIAQATDATVRKPEGAVESIETIVPGLSQRVRPRLDRFGEPVTRPGGPLRRGFTVPEVSPETHTAVGDRLQRLGVTPDVPSGKVLMRGAPLTLTKEQAFAVEQAIGRERKQRLERLLASPEFNGLNETAQTRLVKDALRDATEIVHARVKGRYSAQMPITTNELITPRGEEAR
jgi:hypothetical protein